MATSGMRLPAEELGGAVVTRAFTLNGERITRNTKLTRDEVLAIPVRNREALVSSGQIREFPLSVATSSVPGERFIVRRGDLKWDVVEGHKVNAEPLNSKAEAEALCARPMNGQAIKETMVEASP